MSFPKLFLKCISINLGEKRELNFLLTPSFNRICVQISNPTGWTLLMPQGLNYREWHFSSQLWSSRSVNSEHHHFPLHTSHFNCRVKWQEEYFGVIHKHNSRFIIIKANTHTKNPLMVHLQMRVQDHVKNSDTHGNHQHILMPTVIAHKS